jgi:hypothetical protein
MRETPEEDENTSCPIYPFKASNESIKISRIAISSSNACVSLQWSEGFIDASPTLIAMSPRVSSQLSCSVDNSLVNGLVLPFASAKVRKHFLSCIFCKFTTEPECRQVGSSVKFSGV